MRNHRDLVIFFLNLRIGLNNYFFKYKIQVVSLVVFKVFHLSRKTCSLIDYHLILLLLLVEFNKEIKLLHQCTYLYIVTTFNDTLFNLIRIPKAICLLFI